MKDVLLVQPASEVLTVARITTFSAESYCLKRGNLKGGAEVGGWRCASAEPMPGGETADD